MRKLLLSVAAVALMSSPAGAADQAAQYGSWIVASITNNAGTHQCDMSTSGDHGEFFSLKYNNAEGMFLHFNKDNWSFPNGTKARLALNVDNAPGWNLTATGFRSRQGQEFLQFNFNMAEKNPQTGELVVVEFLNLVRNGRMLKIQFLDGNEGIWTAPLVGSDKAIDSFLGCVASDSAQATTQPFNPAPTQPARTPAPRYQQM